MINSNTSVQLFLNRRKEKNDKDFISDAKGSFNNFLKN